MDATQMVTSQGWGVCMNIGVVDVRGAWPAELGFRGHEGDDDAGKGTPTHRLGPDQRRPTWAKGNFNKGTFGPVRGGVGTDLGTSQTVTGCSCSRGREQQDAI